MTNEEILANAPKGATHIEMLAGTVPYYLKHEITGTSNYHYYGRDNGWSAIRSGPSGKIRSLSDIRRIVELESELDKAYNDLANFEGYPEEVSALRHDIERRKQRYLNLLNKRKEWKKRAESAERERDDKELKITVLETLLSNLWPENYKPMDAVIIEITETLRQQLNGGE